MVTFITILQVNLVMSILLYVMVLVYLYGIQATNMDSSRQGQQQQQQQPSPDPLNSLIIQLLQADLTRGKTRGNQSQQGKSRDTDPPDTLPPILTANLPLEEQGDAEQWGTGGRSDDQEVMLLNSDVLRQHKRYNSPRVLLSDRPPLQPPPLYLTDDYVSGGSDGAAANKTRKKRYVEHKSYRGEYSVCDSESQWVTNKTQAVDTGGYPVTVLAKFKISATQDIKQFFYETRCRTPRPFKGGCRGIDDKNWNSQCKTTQTYVRALTQVRNSVGWRWIRIDTSCVCALSRKRRRT
ncbi:neurotrophin-3 [Cyclopterus lumpus]|uniref:neurotrophin-3 n=1 Tax=Cyclopterus lumpus TaxID=8103 RepID=UPI00148689D0|nr:neurotrophin-3 [Cyclopterus lumpus]